MIQPEPDVVVSLHGSVALVAPISSAAKEWCSENVDLEGVPTLGNGFSCETRYLQGLIDGMIAAGLAVGE